ncbi:LysR family transcriptional regulator [Defluviimonas sp. 20V17]|uniref:LysR family transcriptional regulator n=1 Tax=Allgaiera indica TaxID=765699 RepID=A0AAN4ZXT0_9RHOB|nr:LysR family transcriptional regulator [Allgaiera indica]KDB01809.1 LysR family transcriptional regulator [Defluviimonas sp. 20V17]GHD98909.1 LysR family transcriptional regulator [Allgaiera indica]SDW03675.1 LysR family transcriptional regulator, glycine cleavage system transcriptional activator [Allgaiera indica]
MIPWRDLPPLTALRAFSAYAETGTVVAAADALGVSHAAISQQLRVLEAHLGVQLLRRAGRALTLTPEGELLAGALAGGFGEIARMVERLTGAEAARPLRLTTTPSFAAGWLMPRIAEFRDQHPDIDVVIDPSGAVQPLGRGGYDIALRYGSGDWPGYVVHRLVDSGMVVVAAPGLVGAGPVGDLADLAGYPWMQELGTSEATDFLQAHGVATRARRGIVSLPGNMMIDAARDGMGVAVIAGAFVAADIAAGRLRVLYADDRKKGYFLVTPEGVLRPPARAFARWARRQVAGAGPQTAEA